MYDFLARLVFGPAILKSQVAFLDEIKEGNRVLILGGGTGRLLEYISAQNVIVYYVEPSTKMLTRAQKRNCNAEVNFHQSRFEDFQNDDNYDVIICPFFLDLFSEVHLKEILAKIKDCLKSEGKLIVSDFSSRVKGRYPILLLKLMHVFFRMTSNMESRQLLDHDWFLLELGFQLEKEHSWFGGLIYGRKYACLN